MGTRIWVGVSRDRSQTRVLVRSGATTVLKARLDPTPAHPRALQWLLEAIALWQGTPVRAVLYVGGSGDEYGAPLLRDWFPDFGGPLYTIEWHDRAVRREHDDELTGLGEFDELEQLQLFDALETGR